MAFVGVFLIFAVRNLAQLIIIRILAQDVEPVVLARVYYVIKRNGEAAMSEFVEVFDGTLSQKQVRTLIEKLCRYHLLSQHGNARATRYVWAAG